MGTARFGVLTGWASDPTPAVVTVGFRIEVLGPGVDTSGWTTHGPVPVYRVCCQGDEAPEQLAVWCRAAHEVWVSNQTIPGDRITPLLRAFRQQSIPPEWGGQRSLLHAPEIGPVLVQGVDVPAPPVVETPTPWLCFLRHYPATVGEMDPPNLLRTRIQSGVAKDQKRLQWWLALLFVVTVAGGISLQMLPSWGFVWPMSVFYALFFVLVGLAFTAVKGSATHSRLMSELVVAEALDLQRCWQQVGMTAHAGDQLLLWHWRRLPWLHDLLRPLYLVLPSRSSGLTSRALLESWLPQQHKVHSDAVRFYGQRRVVFKRMMWVFYGLSGLFTALSMLGLLRHGEVVWWVGLLLGASSTMGTLCSVFQGVLAYGPQESLHADVVALLEDAQAGLARAGALPAHEYDELLLELGREILQAMADRAAMVR